MKNITQIRLQEILHYSQETGIFTWTNRAPHGRQGMRAGTQERSGYIQIVIGGEFYKAHRLAWLYVHGQWPKSLIDHANLNKSDNRISNLREATISQNYANSPPRNALGVKGVYVDLRRKTKMFRAGIRVNKKTIHLGGFDSKEEAAAAYAQAAREIYGEFARTSHA